MKKLISVSGRAFVLPDDNVDTDRIIPARFMKCVTFDGLGAHVFEDDRAQSNGKHPFDWLENQGASILIVGANFGSGSSREHAVHALIGWGINAIIGLSFAGIFRGNATANGLVCVDVEPYPHFSLVGILAGEDMPEFTIDLSEKWVSTSFANGRSIGTLCTMPEADRQMLMQGTWDTTAVLLEAGDRIEATASRLPYLGAGTKETQA